jgi:hypothetical protein
MKENIMLFRTIALKGTFDNDHSRSVIVDPFSVVVVFEGHVCL